MKLSRTLLVLTGLFFLSTRVYADGVTLVDVSATTCNSCFPGMPVDLQAQVVVEQTTGTFFNSGRDFLFTGTVLEVLAISGTLNGSPIGLYQAPEGQGSWLNTNLSLGTVYFYANGEAGWFENDNLFNLMEQFTTPPYGTNTAITWTATVNTPEPSSFLILLIGLTGLAFSALKRQG